MTWALGGMKYLCPLPQALRDEATGFVEFANGAAQATIELKNGRKFEQVLVSNGSAVVAARGYDNPPFKTEEIVRVYQSENDKNPEQRDGWQFWDKWR